MKIFVGGLERKQFEQQRRGLRGATERVEGSRRGLAETSLLERLVCKFTFSLLGNRILSATQCPPGADCWRTDTRGTRAAHHSPLLRSATGNILTRRTIGDMDHHHHHHHYPLHHHNAQHHYHAQPYTRDYFLYEYSSGSETDGTSSLNSDCDSGNCGKPWLAEFDGKKKNLLPSDTILLHIQIQRSGVKVMETPVPLCLWPRVLL